MENKWGKKREGRCKLMIHRGGVTVRTVRFYHLTAHCGRWQMNWKPSYQQQRPGTHNLIELKTVHPSRGYSFLSWEITRGCAPSSLPPPFRPNFSTKPDLTAWEVFAGMISFFFSSTNVKKSQWQRIDHTFVEIERRKKVSNPISGRLMSNVVSYRAEKIVFFLFISLCMRRLRG